LHNHQRLQILSCTSRKKLGDILRGLAMIQKTKCVGLVSKTVTFTACSGLFDADDLLGSRVKHWDERHRKGVKVGVRVSVASISSENKRLEETRVSIVKIWRTVGPGLNDGLKASGKLDLSELLLEKLGFSDCFDDFFKFIATNVSNETNTT
jgi:hypothetical protein